MEHLSISKSSGSHTFRANLGKPPGVSCLCRANILSGVGQSYSSLTLEHPRQLKLLTIWVTEDHSTQARDSKTPQLEDGQQSWVEKTSCFLHMGLVGTFQKN